MGEPQPVAENLIPTGKEFMSKFITFEGMDGAGKSTHIAWFAETLRQRGLDVVVTREPGGTLLGEQLREILLNRPMNIGTEALLMFAARLEHIEQVIRPGLLSGKWVISDRFSDASFAYQGGGRGLSWEKLSELEQWVHPDLQPDLTLYFDVPVDVARHRLAKNVTAGPLRTGTGRFFRTGEGGLPQTHPATPAKICGDRCGTESGKG